MWQANIRTRTSLALVQINVHQKVKFIKAVLFYFFDYASLFPDWMALTWLSWMEFKKQNNWANQTRKKQPFKWFMKTKILVACEKSGWTLWQNLEWRLNFFQEFFDSFYVFLPIRRHPRRPNLSPPPPGLDSVRPSCRCNPSGWGWRRTGWGGGCTRGHAYGRPPTWEGCTRLWSSRQPPFDSDRGVDGLSRHFRAF